MSFIGWIKGKGRSLGKTIEDWGAKHDFKLAEKLGRGLQNVCRETSRNTGSTPSYNPNTSSASDTEQIAGILSGFSLGLKSQAQSLERQSKQMIEDYFEVLTNALYEIFGNSMIIYNMKTQKAVAIQGIDNQLLKVLSRRVSLDDPECLRILKMPRGSAKEAAMDAFGRKVINEGLDELCRSLQIGFKMINDSMSKELDDLVQQQINQQKSIVEQLRQMADKFETDAENKEEALLSPSRKMVACDLVVELLEGRKSA